MVIQCIINGRLKEQRKEGMEEEREIGPTGEGEIEIKPKEMKIRNPIHIMHHKSQKVENLAFILFLFSFPSHLLLHVII